MLDVCHASLAKHAGEEFYSVALYTSGEYRYLIDSFSTTQGLKAVAKKYLETKRYQDEWKTVEAAMKALKWNPCDSPYHAEFEMNFGRVGEILSSIWDGVGAHSDESHLQTCQGIHEVCVGVLSRVRDSGIFDNQHVIFNLLMGDQSDEQRLLNAEELNSSGAVERFRSDLSIDENILAELRANRRR